METQPGKGSVLDPLNELGWIQLHRRLIDSRVFQSEGLLKVWIWCLLKANHEDRWVQVETGRGTTEVFVKRGQFIYGRFKAAKELKMIPTTVQGRMAKLENMQNIVIQPVTHYSIVTICNYELYQADRRGDPSPKDYEKRLPHTLFKKASKTVTQNHAISPQFNEDSRHTPNNNTSPKRHPNVTNNNDNKENNKKKHFVEGEPLRLASLLLTEIQRNKETHHLSPFKQPDLQAWGRQIDLMIQLDGRTPERIEEVIQWSQQDQFWWKNILSTRKLREQFDRLEAEMAGKREKVESDDPYKDVPVIGGREPRRVVGY